METGYMESLNGLADNDVVISGIAGYFPSSDSVDELRENLLNGVDLVTEENCRWNKNNELRVPNATGKIRKASNFDNAHFGIHRKQVLSLDPLISLTMERSFEALCDAGVSPSSVKGRNIGVYMGSTNSEADNLFDYEAGGDGFGIVGHNRSMLSSRVAYYLDISGPALTEMSSWCTGMTALTNAYRDVKSGRCEGAIVGAPNLSLMPVMSWHLSQLELLSADAKCRAFDDAATGYGRSDAIVVMYLQRACDAKRAYASIVHADYRCYGARSNYTKPSGNNMASLLTKFYDECGVDPANISYLEAEGSGTKFGDKEELNAVDHVLLRNRKSPLLIGSVKSNLGHTEAASCLVSIVKIILSMECGFIPPNLHYENPNSEVPALLDGRLQVVTEKTKWPGGLAAINSIGIDGNYAHLLLKPLDRKKVNAYEGLPRLLAVSGRTEMGVQQILTKVQEMPLDVEYIRLLQDVHAENIVGHTYRGFTVIEPEKKNNVIVQNFPGNKRALWFIYSGMGSQWPGMGKELMKMPVFKAAVDRCHAILEPRGLDLRHIITTTDSNIFDNILHCFVGIAAVQIGLTNVLISLGIKPDGIIGHSVGELGCAYSDGCMTADEMILSAYARGRASIETKLVKGTMAAVGLGYSQVKDMLPPEIEVACHNGPASCTLSGPTEALEAFVKVLTAKGIFARSVNVANIAYHSRYIKPAAPRLLELLKEIIPTPRPRSHRWISTSVPESRWNTPSAKTSSPDYHTNNLLSSVLFEEGSRHIPPNAVTIEIAPHGLLQAILRTSLGEGCDNVALTQRGSKEGLQFLQTAIGNLYMFGVQPKVSELYPPVQFPVGTGTPSISPVISWEHSEDWPILFEQEVIPGYRRVVLSMSHEEVRNYAGNAVGGRVMIPVAAYLKYVWETLALTRTENFDNLPVIFEDIRIHKTAFIPEKGSSELYLLLQRGTGEFEVIEDETKEILATGRCKVPEKIEDEFVVALDVSPQGLQFKSEDIYREFEQRGYEYSGLYKSITSVVFNDKGSVSRTLWHNNWVAFISSMLQQIILQTGENQQDVQIPTSIQRIAIDPLKHTSAIADFEVTSHLSSSIIRGGGVQLHGLRTKSFIPPTITSAPLLRMDTLKIVPYKNPRLQSVKDFVSVSIQLAVENCKAEIEAKSGVTVIEDNADHHSLVPQLEEFLSQYPNIQLEVKTTCSKDESERNPNSFLVVTSPSLLSHAAQYLGSAGCFLLTRVDNTGSWQCGDDLTVVLEQHFGRGKFLLLRKTINWGKSEPMVIDIDDLGKTWIDKMRSCIRSQTRRQVILLTKEEPQCGIKSYVKHILKEKGNEQIRCFFLIDKSAPTFSLSEKFYQEQLKSQLLVNIYQDKTWGSIRHLSLSEDQLVVTNQTELPLPSLTLDGVELNYLGLNKKESAQCKLGHVDFSGRSGAQRWVMGVARFDSASPDPMLTWQVPEAWSMEDAATVPLAYATAYYALVLTCNIRPRQRVLIQEGCSAIGQAAIAIALDLSCRIFTTVANDAEREFLLKRYPELIAEHVYSSKNTRFELAIMTASKSKGVGIVLNSLQGRALHASIRCVADFGKFVQLGRADMEKNATIGMLFFNRSVAMFGVASDNLFNACSSWKQRLHDAVQSGIDAGVVQPLEARVFLHQQYDRALEMVSDGSHWCKVLINVREANRASNFLQSEIIPRLKLDPTSAYLIVGGTTDMWLDLTEWLLRRGAQRLLVAQQVSQPTSYITRRLNLLSNYHRATVVLATAEETTTAAGVDALVLQAEKLGPLGGIFTLPIVVSENKARETEQSCLWIGGSNSLLTVRHLDAASRRRRLQHFVCLLCDETESVCAARRQAGQTALAVQWLTDHDATNLRPTLATLDRLLGGNSEHTVMLSQAMGPMQKHASTYSNASLHLVASLPADLHELRQLGEDMLSQRRLQEVRTLSPGLLHVSEVPPVFLVPGLAGSAQQSLKLLVDRLMYPGVIIKLPRGGASIQEMAGEMAKNVRRVQPFGPYNLVADSWGGALTLEIARHLEALGERTQMILLEAAPESNQANYRQLGEKHMLPTNLLCQLLSIKQDKVRAEIQALPSWERKLAHALSALPDQADCLVLETAATSIYEHINALLEYKPEEGALLTGLVTLIRPLSEEDDNCGLIKACKNTVNVHLVGEGRAGMLSSLETCNIIGDNVLIQV